MKPVVFLLCAAMAVSACSQGEDIDGLFGGGAGGANGSGTVLGPDGRPIEVSSIAYFNQVIGDTVLFPVDQSSLTAEAMRVLDQQAGWLMAQAGASVSVEGHADEQGTREYNFRLSARRASAVRDYLVAKGIQDSRLSTLPFGKERPLAVCSDETCWSRNRRAVTVVTSAPGV